MKQKIKERKKLKKIKRTKRNIKKRQSEKQSWLIQQAAKQKGTTIRNPAKISIPNE